MIEQSCSDWMFNQHLLANSGRVSLTQCQRQPAVAHYFQRRHSQCCYTSAAMPNISH
jgi:hypothetical protein